MNNNLHRNENETKRHSRFSIQTDHAPADPSLFTLFATTPNHSSGTETVAPRPPSFADELAILPDTHTSLGGTRIKKANDDLNEFASQTAVSNHFSQMMAGGITPFQEEDYEQFASCKQEEEKLSLQHTKTYDEEQEKADFMMQNGLMMMLDSKQIAETQSKAQAKASKAAAAAYQKSLEDQAAQSQAQAKASEAAAAAYKKTLEIQVDFCRKNQIQSYPAYEKPFMGDLYPPPDEVFDSLIDQALPFHPFNSQAKPATMRPAISALPINAYAALPTGHPAIPSRPINPYYAAPATGRPTIPSRRIHLQIPPRTGLPTIPSRRINPYAPPVSGRPAIPARPLTPHASPSEHYLPPPSDINAYQPNHAIANIFNTATAGMVSTMEEETDEEWLAMFESLKFFKKNNGHCDVPIFYPPNPELASWAQIQRNIRPTTFITMERHGFLTSIGFSCRKVRDARISNNKKETELRKNSEIVRASAAPVTAILQNDDVNPPTPKKTKR